MPRRDGRGDALHLNGAEFTVLEEIADQSARAGGDDDGVRLGHRLQPGSEVRRFSNGRLFLRRPFADQIPTITKPVAIPTRVWSLTDLISRRPTASIRPSPARTARSASSS